MKHIKVMMDWSADPIWNGDTGENLSLLDMEGFLGLEIILDLKTYEYLWYSIEKTALHKKEFDNKAYRLTKRIKEEQPDWKVSWYSEEFNTTQEVMDEERKWGK